MQTVGAIDVGSSATRLSTVSVSPTGVVEGRLFRRYGLRLGTDVYSDGRITAPRLDVLTDTFVEIAHVLRSKAIHRFRAVATAALRDAANCQEVVRHIRECTGIDIEVVSGHEESRLARRALLRSMGSVRPATLLVDLGGGSLEMEWACGRVVRSLPFGTLRLVEAYPALRGPIDSHALESIKRRLMEGLRSHVGRGVRARTAIATGGALGVLARLIPHRALALPAVDLERLPEVTREVAAMEIEQRVERLGVRRDRADVMVPAMLIFIALRELLGLQTLVVPGTGIRETMLQELVRPTSVRPAVRHLAALLGRRATVAQRDVALARSLFVALTPIHGLWSPALAAQEVAAYLCHLDDARTVCRPQHPVSWPPDPSQIRIDGRIRDVAAAAASLAGGSGGDRSTLGPGDAVPVQVIAGILTLARAMGEASTARPPRVDLIGNPLTIDANLSRPMDTRHTLALAQALGRDVRVQ